MPESRDSLEPQNEIAERLKPSYTLIEISRKDDFSSCGLREDLAKTNGRLKVVVHPLHEKNKPRRDHFWKEETESRYKEYFDKLKSAFKNSKDIFLTIIGRGHEEEQKFKEFARDTNYQGKVYLIRSEEPDKITPCFEDVSDYEANWETFTDGLKGVGLKEAVIMGTRLELGGNDLQPLVGDKEWLALLAKRYPSEFQTLQQKNYDPNRLMRGCAGAVARRLLHAGVSVRFCATFPDKSPYEQNKQGILRHMRTVK